MTQIFIDTANLDKIKEIKKWGIIKGVTTNQKIFEKEKGCNFKERAKEILKEAYPYPVSLEGPNEIKELIEKGKAYSKWGKNVVIKVPMLEDGSGLEAVQVFKVSNIKSNVTACMSLNQTFLAANAGATYVSLFYNRIKDFSNTEFAIQLIEDTMNMLKQGNYQTKLIIGSIRSPNDIKEILTARPHIITITPDILEKMCYHERTISTLKDFDEAWKEFKKHEKK